MVANRIDTFSLAINNVTHINTQTACDDRSVHQIALDSSSLCFYYYIRIHFRK